MMALSSCSIVHRKLVLSILLVNVFIANYVCFAYVQQPSCHHEERSALLQLKHSFVIDNSASSFGGAYPKVLDWNSSSNCCLWDGIDCDAETSHVIGLDLGSSCLFGSFNSHSPLFSLVHLQMLDLSDNHFNFSHIPAQIGKLFGLTSLNLSSSFFYGQVPLQISNLKKLSTLDLSMNIDPVTGDKFLHFKNPNFKMLVQNLSRLETLSLTYVDISSEVPDLLTNFTSLTTLYLTDCELYGEFPAKIFQLPNLQSLNVSFNENLIGRLPEFQQRSPLKTLDLGSTNFFGSLPSSLEKLESMNMLDFNNCNFSGPIPSSLGKLAQLIYLDLKSNNLNGKIPCALKNLTKLAYLSLGYNQIIGSIPPCLWNLTHLSVLDLRRNQLHGPISQSLSMLVNLERLYLNKNNLGGSLKFDIFFNMKSLSRLRLGYNNFTSVIIGNASRNATSHQWKSLDLSSFKLRKFPYFLKHQNELEFLELTKNDLSGQIPNWIWNISKETLIEFKARDNFLTGFNLPRENILPWVNLGVLDISFNMLQGPLPIPSPSILAYNLSHNMLIGEISPLFCNMSSLIFLELSDNKLRGEVPQCLANSSGGLLKLDLSRNSFQRLIPQLCSNDASQLKVIDVSDNQLQGKLPRSLSNCLMLEALIVSNNQLHDSFPSWLGSLPELKLLILHQNQFYGTIERSRKGEDFSNLQVLDLSSNNFTGELPSQYINKWAAMKSNRPNGLGLSYMGVGWNRTLVDTVNYKISQNYRITIMTKGVVLSYEAILDVYAFIDLSDNRFEGEISELFGNLKALHSLNFSNNMLTSCIPSSFGNLTELESLDLSQNNLSCQIPQELTQLGFLSSFNVSHNNLTRSIPQGKQFDTFDATSFDGNPELCGSPLPKKCGNPPPSPSPPPKDHKGSESLLKENWMFILAGYIGGLVVGVALADIALTGAPRWLVEKLPERRRRRQRRARRT